jgi:hypothetical protein
MGCVTLGIMFFCIIYASIQWVEQSLWGTIFWSLLAAVSGVMSFALSSVVVLEVDPPPDLPDSPPEEPEEPSPPPESSPPPETQAGPGEEPAP